MPAGYRAVLRSDELPAPDAASGDAADDAELAPAVMVEAALADRTVLVARLASGEVAAFARSCPHLGTPLQRGTLCGRQLRCAQHGYVYDVRTGRNVVPADEAGPEQLARLRPGYLPTHPALEQDGWVWVSDTPRPPPA